MKRSSKSVHVMRSLSKQKCISWKPFVALSFLTMLLSMYFTASALNGQAILYTFDGDSVGDTFGTSVSGAGDVNADGFADLIVGAHTDDNNGSTSGSARVFSGFDGSILYTFNGDTLQIQFGLSVSGAGDVDGDGFDDVVAAAPGDGVNGHQSGTVRVFSGFDGSILYNFHGDDPKDFLGSVSGAGDVNADGYADIVAGAPGDDNTGHIAGSVRVYSGFDGSILYTFNGNGSGDFFGVSVSDAGDVNADGYADVIAGSNAILSAPPISGFARVFSGFDGSILYNFTGDSADDHFGAAVSGAGDVNADGFADLIVGAPQDDNNGPAAGSAQVFSGADGSVLYTFDGDSAGDRFGRTVSGAGDLDADGFADLIVGAPEDDNNGNNSGSISVFSGFDGSILFTLDGDSADKYFGYSVSGAGDVNKDTLADVIVGATSGSEHETVPGSASVIVSELSPYQLTIALALQVMNLNLKKGIDNSLDAKLEAVLDVLDDLIVGNDHAAVNMLEAFMAQVKAQSGKEISESDAMDLNESAQKIINLLNAE